MISIFGRTIKFTVFLNKYREGRLFLRVGKSAFSCRNLLSVCFAHFVGLTQSNLLVTIFHICIVFQEIVITMQLYLRII